jgi:hypothetical protein
MTNELLKALGFSSAAKSWRVDTTSLSRLLSVSQKLLYDQIFEVVPTFLMLVLEMCVSRIYCILWSVVTNNLFDSSWNLPDQNAGWGSRTAPSTIHSGRDRQPRKRTVQGCSPATLRTLFHMKVTILAKIT